MEKTMAEMTNKELFCVLTGAHGVMPQMFLRNAVRDYRKRNLNRSADLHTMLQEYLQQEMVKH